MLSSSRRAELYKGTVLRKSIERGREGLPLLNWRLSRIGGSPKLRDLQRVRCPARRKLPTVPGLRGSCVGVEGGPFSAGQAL
jgi:hypothetical protein